MVVCARTKVGNSQVGGDGVNGEERLCSMEVESTSESREERSGAATEWMRELESDMAEFRDSTSKRSDRRSSTARINFS